MNLCLVAALLLLPLLILLLDGRAPRPAELGSMGKERRTRTRAQKCHYIVACTVLSYKMLMKLFDPWSWSLFPLLL